MNSTLPDFSPAPAAAVNSAPGAFNSTGLAGLLAGAGEAHADFGALMAPASAGPPIAAPLPSGPGAGVVPSPAAWRPDRPVAFEPMPETAAGTLAAALANFSPAATPPVPVEGRASAASARPDAKGREVPAELRELAVAFAAVIPQGFAAEPAPSPVAPPSSTTGNVPAAPVMPGPKATETIARTVPVDLAGEVAARTAASGLAVPLSDLHSPALAPTAPASAPAAEPPVSDAGSEPSPSAFAGDGAIELPVAAPLLPTADDSAAVEFQAELQLPGQPLVRIETPGYLGARREKFAAAKSAGPDAPSAPSSTPERKFEAAGNEEVTGDSPRAGIAVAELHANMPVAPTEDHRATRSPLDSMVSPVRAEFQTASVAAPSERSAPAPAEPAALASFAGRAVETVTGLVDTQFAASMQRSGSVQLRLKFGHEDLSVRVALRDGAVHADFQTDSAPLRAALEREWHAVAAVGPGQLPRFLEPAFAPASPAGGASSGGHDSRQPSFAQQQAQSDDRHQPPPRHAADPGSPFGRRSLVGENFVPAAPAPRVAAFLPTSLRLSALA